MGFALDQPVKKVKSVHTICIEKKEEKNFQKLWNFTLPCTLHW